MIGGVISNLKLGSFVAIAGIGWNTASGDNCCTSPCSVEVFLSFDLGGFVESEMGSLCFPRVWDFETERNLASFAGKADEAQPMISSPQALAASLTKKRRSISNVQNIIRD